MQPAGDAVTARSDLIATFSELSVLVLGDAILDCYLEGHPRPGSTAPIVDISSREDVPGGAANTAANAAALGATVTFAAVAGDDLGGQRLRRALARRRIASAQLIVEEGRATLSKHRVVSDGELVVRFDEGDARPIDPLTEQALCEAVAGLVNQAEAVIVSDSGYGTLTPPVVDRLGEALRRHPRPCIVDSRRLELFAPLHPTAVKPSYDQAMRLLSLDLDRTASDRAGLIAAHGERLLRLTGASTAFVTLGGEGAVLLRHDLPVTHIPARATAVEWAAGAGDTFTAALGLALAAGAGAPDAAELAAAAAAIVLAKPGTSVCAAAELAGALPAALPTG